MPALTRKTKRRHADSPEEEDSDDEMVVGILAQRSARRQAAQEAEREPQQVRVAILHLFLALLITHPSPRPTTLIPVTRTIKTCHVN